MDLASLVAEECERRHVPGVCVATIEDGSLAESSSFGLPVGTVFEAASMSKTVTAYVALQSLDLDVPLVNYLTRPYLDDERLGFVTVAAAPSLNDEWLTPQVEVHEVWGGGGPEPGSTWGLGSGLQASDGSFWHWGWNIGFLSFAVGWPAKRRGVVVFTNGQQGLWICKTVVSWFADATHPAFGWLEH